SLVADSLGIQVKQLAVDDRYYDPHWSRNYIRTPEPNLRIFKGTQEASIATEMSEQAKVWFFGEGPDNALTFEWRMYLRWLCDRRDWIRLFGAGIQYIRTKQPREWLNTINVHHRWKGTAEARGRADIPKWMNKDFVKDVDLGARVHRATDPGTG